MSFYIYLHCRELRPMNAANQPKDIEMTKQEHEDWIAGVRRYIADNGLIQKEVAVAAGKSPVNFSKVLNHHSGSSPKYRKSICDVLGLSEFEAIRLGESERSPQVTRLEPALPKPSPIDFLPADEVVQLLAVANSSLATVSSNFLKMDVRLKYWVQLFESLPIPVVVVRDGIVYSQNRKSRAMWDGVGKTLCEGCQDQACKEFGCDIKDALDKGRDIEKYKLIVGDYYKVQTSHFTANSHEYNIIVITPINECYAVSEKLEKINKERAFIASNAYEPPEYYAGADRIVSYVNDAFLKMFEVERKDILTTDDFHILVSKRLFSHHRVVKAADEARELHQPTEVQAKLSNNKTVTFIFRPHVEDNELVGVMVTVLTPEMYELFNNQSGESP